MKILILNQFYPPDPAPTGQFAQSLAQTLAERGHEVHVICSQRSYSEDKVLLKSEIQAGVHVRRVGGFGFGRKRMLGRLLDYLSFYLFATFRALFGPRYRVAVFLTTPPYIGFIGHVLRLFKRTRIIQWIMDLYPDAMIAHGLIQSGRLEHRLLSWCTRRLLRHSHRIWGLGPFARDKIAAYLAPGQSSKIEVVPLWGDPSLEPMPSHDSPFRSQYGFDGRLGVMYSGNMGLGHDFTTIVDAAQRVQDLPEIRFAIVGGGPRLEGVRRDVEQRGLKNVAFYPYAPRDQLRESLCAADVHLISQIPAWQGIIVPSKMAGILAVGRPVLFVGAEQNEIARWTLDSQAGRTFAIDDGEGLASAIEELYRNSQLRETMGANGRRFYEKQLASDVGLGRLVESVERLGSIHKMSGRSTEGNAQSG